jgi:hypothetical protein
VLESSMFSRTLLPIPVSERQRVLERDQLGHKYSCTAWNLLSVTLQLVLLNGSGRKIWILRPTLYFTGHFVLKRRVFSNSTRTLHTDKMKITPFVKLKLKFACENELFTGLLW